MFPFFLPMSGASLDNPQPYEAEKLSTIFLTLFMDNPLIRITFFLDFIPDLISISFFLPRKQNLNTQLEACLLYCQPEGQ